MTYYRVFYDDFESYSLGTQTTTSGWIDDGGSHPLPDIVSSSADGIITPFGSQMCRHNINGTTFTAHRKNGISPLCNDEVFIRIRYAFDANYSFNPSTTLSGAHIMRLWDQNNSNATLDYLITNNQGSSWNSGLFINGNPPISPIHFFGNPTRSVWKTWEFWAKYSTGECRIWLDGTLPSANDYTGTNTANFSSGPKRIGNLYPQSNYSAPALDATNYMYIDNVEIFSDLAAGPATPTVGLFSDATIQASSSEPATVTANPTLMVPKSLMRTWIYA